MSGVWTIEDGVLRLVTDPNKFGRKKVLVYTSTDEVVSSYSSLDEMLKSLGWERYLGGSGDSDLIQYHKRSSVDLISLPKDFSEFNSPLMYDIVVKNPNSFHVRDLDKSTDQSEEQIDGL